MSETIYSYDVTLVRGGSTRVYWTPGSINENYAITEDNVGFIDGNVTIEEVPVTRVVALYLEVEHPINQQPGNLHLPANYVLLRQTRSDPVTGYYRFDSLQRDLRYTIIAFDANGEYDPAIKSGLIPTLMV